MVWQRGEAATGSETGTAGTQHHGNDFKKYVDLNCAKL
jgi:hypothetical protein